MIVHLWSPTCPGRGGLVCHDLDAIDRESDDVAAFTGSIEELIATAEALRSRSDRYSMRAGLSLLADVLYQCDVPQDCEAVAQAWFDGYYGDLMWVRDREPFAAASRSQAIESLEARPTGLIETSTEFGTETFFVEFGEEPQPEVA